MMITGSCHCGAVKWTLEAVPQEATACNCTVCRRYGVLWAYGHENEGAHVAGVTAAYIRGKSIEFHFCPKCGCVAYWRATGSASQTIGSSSDWYRAAVWLELGSAQCRHCGAAGGA